MIRRYLSEERIFYQCAAAMKDVVAVSSVHGDKRHLHICGKSKKVPAEPSVAAELDLDAAAVFKTTAAKYPARVPAGNGAVNRT